MNIQLIETIAYILVVCALAGFSAYKQWVAMSPAQKHEQLKSVVRSVVAAVEQQCGAMDGPSKKKEAVRVASQLLGDMHLNVSPVLLDTLIEQAVLLLNSGNAQVDPQATQVGIPAVKLPQ